MFWAGMLIGIFVGMLACLALISGGNDGFR